MGALTEEEWEIIHDPEGVLVKFLIEEINGQSCARLKHYLFMTKRFLTFCKERDANAEPLLTNRNAKALADDESYLAEQIAKQIKEQGLNIKGMLESVKMESKIDDICHIYARLVLAYRNEENCKKIVRELIKRRI